MGIQKAEFIKTSDICMAGNQINLAMFNNDMFNAVKWLCKLKGYWMNHFEGVTDCENSDYLHRVFRDQLQDFADKFGSDFVFFCVDNEWKLQYNDN